MCGSRKLDLRALATAPPGFPIQHTRLARLLRGAVISRDPDFTGGNGVVIQTELRDPAVGHVGEMTPRRICSRGFVAVTPLEIPARFRRLDVRTDDAARQPAALLPRAPNPAAAPNDPLASPSPDR